MTAYIIRRLLMGLLIIWLVTLIVFFSIRLLPGDPLVIYIGQQSSTGSMTEEEIQALRERYNLDKPILAQYGIWISEVLRGDLGVSIFYHEDVGVLMRERFPITLHLGLTAFILANILGVAFGLIAAIRRGTWIDTLVTTLSNLGITVPVFWLGMVMMYVVGYKLHWLPFPGYVSPTEDFWLSTKLIIMPVACMTVTQMAGTARQTRSSMLEVIRQDYIRTAWSKGLRERVVILRHALKISLIPVITMMGVAVGMIFAGAVLIETVFAIPGIGRLLTSSIFAQDYPVIQSGVLVMSIIIVLANLIVDISYGWFDPRVRYS